MKGLKIIIGICIIALVTGCKYLDVENANKYVPKGIIEMEDEETLREKYWDLRQKIAEKEYELYIMKRVLAMYKMDIEAQEKNLTVEYKKIPNSKMVIRIEYNGSHYDSMEIQDLMEDVKVEKR